MSYDMIYSLSGRWSDLPPLSPCLEIVQHISIYLSIYSTCNKWSALPFLSFNMVPYLNEDLIIQLGFF